MSKRRIRIQFPISPANQLQLVKMIDTAMEKISRSFPNPLFHDVILRQNYPIIETTYPPLEVSAHDQIKLEIYLHSHVVDAKLSYLYMTARCLDASLIFPAAVHGLDFPRGLEIPHDHTRTFLPFDCVGNLLSIPTLDRTSQNTIISEAILAMRLDSLSYAKAPFVDYNKVTVRKGILSFDPAPVSYTDIVSLSLSDLHIDKDTLELGKVDFDWNAPNVFRSEAAPSQPAAPLVQDPSNVALTTTSLTQVASTIATTRQSVKNTRPFASLSDLGADGFTPALDLTTPYVARAMLPQYSSPKTRLLTRPLTTGQQLAHRDGLPFPRRYIPSLSFNTGNSYLQNEAQNIGMQLLSQNDQSRFRRSNSVIPCNLFPPVPSSTPKASDRVTVIDDISRHTLQPKPKEIISIHKSIDDLSNSDKNISRKSSLADPVDQTSDTDDDSLRLNTTVVSADPVPATSGILTRSAKKKQDTLRVELILQHERSATDIGLVPLVEGELTHDSLFILPKVLVEFGMVLAAFMNLPQQKDHWYFIDALRPLFKQNQVDEQWIFSLNKDHSALFILCRKIDSAYAVIYDTTLTDPILAHTAQSFQDYMKKAES